METGGASKLSYTIFFLSGLAILLLGLLVWALRSPRVTGIQEGTLPSPDELAHRHVDYLPIIKQTISKDDYLFLSWCGMRGLSRRVRRERRKIALTYLSCLRGDFLQLWRMARVIASMSQKVGAGQEFERLRLGVTFELRYELVRLKFLLGFSPSLELGSLSQVVSNLAVRMETAVREIGESAALAAKFGSSLDGRNVNTL